MHPIGRRQALKGMAIAAGVPLLPRRRPQRNAPRIVVVGAGLAGLTAAYRISQRTDWPVVVLEAGATAGGRVRTIRGLSGGGYAEAGGTFISTGDTAIRGLMRELQVDSIDLNPLWPGGGYEYYFEGKHRSGNDVFEGERAAARTATNQFQRFRWPIDYRRPDDEAVRLDRMSIARWIDRHVGGSLYPAYLKTYFETDYAAPVELASALHIVADYAAPGRNYDERFLIASGGDSLVQALVDRLPETTLITEAKLTALRSQGRRYVCTYLSGDTVVDVSADAVVLALPFSALRDVDVSAAGFPRGKRKAIRELGMGPGVKINLVFGSAAWRERGSGDSVSDLVTGWTWPGHIGQSSDDKLMVSLTTFADPTSPVHGVLDRGLAQPYLTALEQIFPGSEEVYADTGYIDRWDADPYFKGTYSYYPAGSFTEIAGAEAEPSGRVFFAGEHTARYGNRGTMNGAVASGARAAREVLRALGG